ncbi:MAG: carbohydrate kinase [Thiotrichaceae bacterium]|nr:carbohydrate kinase [Thiotrichaceae bacterium]
MTTQKVVLPSPVIFGEVLFDRFADGNVVLGGAAFNVAWHLKGFGLEPLLISAVGNDALGDKVLHSMRAWQMSCSGIQSIATAPTGSVNVSIINEEPQFEIVANQAYDFIDGAQAQQAIASLPCPSLLYHGTLGIRHAASYAALNRLRIDQSLPFYFDINLRPPWVCDGVIEEALQQASWVKVNEHEFHCLQKLLKLSDDDAEAAVELQARYGLKSLLITRGKAGASGVAEQGVIKPHSAEVAGMVDTVGAGDAFSAVVIYGLTVGWQWSQIVKRAVAFATAICGVRGGVFRLQQNYDHFLQQWRE